MSRTINKSAARSATVTLPRSEYERLLAKAGEDISGAGPALPKADAQGNLPAREYLRASIARELIRRRTSAGLTQVQLAELAGVWQETISRIESGKAVASDKVMTRLEQALHRRESTKTRRTAGKRISRQKAA